MTTLAVIAGAGSGTRLGSKQPKALVDLDGIPLIVHAVRSMEESACVAGAFVTAPPDYLDVFRQVLSTAGYSETGNIPVHVISGGKTRQASVFAALQIIEKQGSTEYVLIHDAARPLTPPDMIQRIVHRLEEGNQAVIPALPVVDTIKEVTASDLPGVEKVHSTPQRARLRAVQTPQGFTFSLLYDAHKRYASQNTSEELAASDDAALMENMGHTVTVVHGSERALKITRPLDLSIAAMLLRDEHTSPPSR